MTVLCSMPKHTWNSGEDSLHPTELGFPISLISSLRLTMQHICTVMLSENTLKAGGWPQLHVRGLKRTPKRLSALIAQVRQARAWWQPSEYWKASRYLIGAADSPNWNRSRAVTCRWGSVAFVFEVCSGSASIGTVGVRRCCSEWDVGAQMHQWPWWVSSSLKWSWAFRRYSSRPKPSSRFHWKAEIQREQLLAH